MHKKIYDTQILIDIIVYINSNHSSRHIRCSKDIHLLHVNVKIFRLRISHEHFLNSKTHQNIFASSGF